MSKCVQNPAFCVKFFGFGLFRIVVLLGGFYKYDFWNLETILDFKNIFSKKIFYFSKLKKNLEKVRNLEKVEIVGILRIFNGFP